MNSPRATTADRVRQVGITIAMLFCVFGTLVGVGVLGTRVEESSGGRLASDATLIAPAGPAFSIWSVIYLGLAAFTVWQWLPGQATSPRLRRIGWAAALTMVLNAVWLLVTQQGWLWVSVLVIVVLALTLGWLLRTPPATDSLAEKVVVDGTFGLYLGWVAVATCANIAATLVGSGVPATGVGAVISTAVVLAAVAGLAVLFTNRLGARWGVVLAMAWGLGWIAVGRLADEPRSVVVALLSAVVAVFVLALCGLARTRGRASVA